jgi:hypothetical protein
MDQGKDAVNRFVELGVLGKPGGPVPEVDPEDIKAVCQLYDDMRANHPGENVSISFRVIQATCKPGVDAKSVWYRAKELGLLLDMQKLAEEQQLSVLPCKIELNDSTFKAIAKIPMQWQQTLGVPRDFCFDIKEFARLVGESA